MAEAATMVSGGSPVATGVLMIVMGILIVGIVYVFERVRIARRERDPSHGQ